ncbi:unnamed protein product [Calypogeia fissa]
MAMETYLQQLKILREQMSEHEDKVAGLSAEQSDQQNHIQYLQKDLATVRNNIHRAKEEFDACSKERCNMSKLIVSRQQGLQALDKDCWTLSQAWKLMNGDVRKQSSRVLERKLYFEKIEAEARLQLHQYQAHYESVLSKEETIRSDESLGQAAEEAPGVEEEKNKEMIADDVEMVEAGDDGIASENRLRQLEEELQEAEEQLKSLEAENDQLEAESGPLEERRKALEEEKLAEEDFVQTLHDRLEQLKTFSQDIVCCSCKHANVIEYEGSKFVIRST